MTVGIVMSVRMEMSSLICTLYIFTKAEETYVQNVMQFTCIAKKNLKHAGNVQCSLHASNVFIQMRLHLFLSNAIKARPHLRMLILQYY